MLQFDVTATERELFGKGASRALRRSGKTPAVLYGPKTENTALSLDTKSFTKALIHSHGQNVLITLDIQGDKSEKRHVMIKEVQTDPIRDSLVHADFYEVSLDEPMTLKVPVKPVGKAKGVDMGGELHFKIPEVTLQGLVLNFPDYIEVDVTSLGIGSGVKCKELSIPENMTLLDDVEAVCISVEDISKSKSMMVEEPEEEAAAEEGAPEAEEGEAASEEEASS